MLYQQLISGHEINKDLYCFEYKISTKTFERDVLNIRLFLSESYSGKDVIFDKARNIYKMTGVQSTEILSEALFPILEILLQCNAFNKFELNGIIDSLLSVANAKDKPKLRKLVQDSSKSSETALPILKMIADINNAIERGVKIELRQTKGKQIKNVTVSPARVKYIKNRFYLEAYRDGMNEAEHIKIENIDSFILTSLTAVSM